MRGMIAMAACGIGGAAYFAGADTPDYDRTIERRPAAVYAAFSALGQEGTVTSPADGERRLTQIVAKEPGSQIRYELRVDDRPIVEIEVNFEEANAGAATRVTAEMELDQVELSNILEMADGGAMALVPEALFDMQFANLMDDLVRDVEAGRPLTALGLQRAGMQWRRGSGATASERRSQARQAQRQAVAPMVRPEPMVDPNQAARDYMSGR